MRTSWSTREAPAFRDGDSPARVVDELGFVPVDRAGGELLINLLAE